MKVDDAYFQAMYAHNPDPWSFGQRWYDQRKYGITLATLRQRRYRSGFEPGCSIGVLSESLAARCDNLLCTDLIDTAVEQTRARMAQHPHVTVRQQALPQWPDGTFDLIVLSEVLYYLTADDLDTVLDRATTSLLPGGDLVAVQWRHHVPEHRRSGDEVYDALARRDSLEAVAQYLDPDFRLDIFSTTTPAPRSVAQREGLSA